MLLCFIDPRVKKIRNEAFRCPGIIFRTFHFYQVIAWFCSLPYIPKNTWVKLALGMLLGDWRTLASVALFHWTNIWESLRSRAPEFSREQAKGDKPTIVSCHKWYGIFFSLTVEFVLKTLLRRTDIHIYPQPIHAPPGGAKLTGGCLHCTYSKKTRQCPGRKDPWFCSVAGSSGSLASSVVLHAS